MMDYMLCLLGDVMGTMQALVFSPKGDESSRPGALLKCRRFVDVFYTGKNRVVKIARSNF
jgi:hypothetical protein